MRSDPSLGETRWGEGGFTLLEVIVALTLMSILAVVLTGSLSFGSRVWERTSRVTRSSGDLISTYQFLETSFDHLAKPLPDPVSGERPRDFIGTSQEVSFQTSGFAEVGLAGPRLISLRRVADRLQVSLPLTDGETTELLAREREFVLLGAIHSLAIAYRGYGPDRRDTGWVSDWPAGEPPLLVRIAFNRDTGEDQVWLFKLPELAH